MDKLKYIRIQDQQGDYGDRIPLEVDSDSVSMANGNSLQDNLAQIRAEIDTKISKVNGKVLSTNDFTTENKNKLNGIQVGATRVIIDTNLNQPGQAAEAKAVGDALAQVKSYVSSPPLRAATAAEMLNTRKIYVYTGNEIGYIHGHWYYYDNGQWKDGGAYSPITTQDELTALVNQTRADLIARTQTAEGKADAVQVSLGNLEDRVDTAESDIDNLETKSTKFVEDGYVQNGIAYFTNNDKVLFEITGIGGGGGGGDDPVQSEYWSTKSKNWAVGLTGGSNPSDENNSKYWSTQSASYAHGGTNTRAGEDTDNAEYFKNLAQGYATQAQTYLNTSGQTWINTLEAKETELEGDLDTHADNLETQLTTFGESYIHGGTGTRPNEDIDNAQYYFNRSKMWAIGSSESASPSATNNAAYYAGQAETYYNNMQTNSVTTFNSRRGAVVPTAGDYIAAMITRGGSTVEADLTAAQTAIATKANQVDLEAVQDSKVDKDTALLNLDTTAASGLDYDLYTAIATLGWNTGSANVIVTN